MDWYLVLVSSACLLYLLKDIYSDIEQRSFHFEDRRYLWIRATIGISKFQLTISENYWVQATAKTVLRILSYKWFSKLTVDSLHCN